jgi:hypothetical protein
VPDNPGRESAVNWFRLTVTFLVASFVIGCGDENDKGTSPGNGANKQITLDHVDGLSGKDSVLAGAQITFYIRLDNTTGDTISGFTNGFRVYSPDGARWEPITWDTASIGWDTIYDGGIFFNPFSVDGVGADTIGFGGFRIFNTGIADSFNEVVFLISTRVDASYAGRTICLDSTWYPPTNEWIWSVDSKTVKPEWDGPHCFWIVR